MTTKLSQETASTFVGHREGDVFFSHASGKRGNDSPDPMSLDTVFWIASCTKLITSIACMQMVEQGKLALDDAEQVQSLAPELGDVQVVERETDGSFRLVPKDRGITLRMLLNHTSGFGYAFEDLKLRDWSRPLGLDDFSGHESDVLHRPLVNQPGTRFQYGVGLDWAGVLVERVSGLSLEEYFQQFILRPLGIESVTFFPSVEMKMNLAYMHQRDKDGTLKTTDHLYRYPLLPCKPGMESNRFCMGGAGCFGKPIEYCKLIATLLNDGTDPKTGTQLLRPETSSVEMFTDQIPDMPRYCNEYTPSGKPLLANPCPLVPCDDDLTEGWGLSFSLSHRKSPTGRAAGSGSWEGLANLFWFADRENGVGAIIASQILPYGDLQVLGCMEEVEKMIYDELESRNV
ncbi:beta-lactamase family protein [Aspergillus nomiae NRRL 13137]|uniref:Beta-lactamase family protein n=1 Tax=Aspergillus nomiae NRRL (strain ATCC 15546 / NRRL 13137 / CBS 260.88 / M93) TaxID=1509407 RepID=A0A0L1J8F3_ASPN3|nr:beta-lactamase family protein [Aspergillus nomiae NRRL 13137]KNG88086.1 beta-lactamase family protein [Aspergillus nomiae NRRL 13137]